MEHEELERRWGGPLLRMREPKKCRHCGEDVWPTDPRPEFAGWVHAGGHGSCMTDGVVSFAKPIEEDE